VLRFWTAPGVLGPAAWGGVVMPSVDRVGRHFPLTVAQPVATLAHALAAGAWYGAIDAAARTVLHRDAQIDHLDHELALAGAADGAPDSDQTQHAARLLQLHGENARCTVWWCSDTAGPAAARCFVGLPPPAAFLDALGAHAP
jgi:type VI secretion system protein ImpM